MNKFVTLLVVVGALPALATVTVRYHNADSQKHVFSAVCSGSKSKVTFEGNTTGSATIQGSGPCTVFHQGGEVKLSGGEQVEIKESRITVK